MPEDNVQIAVPERVKEQVVLETNKFLSIDESFFRTREFKKMTPRSQKRCRYNYEKAKQKEEFIERTAITASYLKTLTTAYN